jgi:hypothetical protein
MVKILNRKKLLLAKNLDRRPWRVVPATAVLRVRPAQDGPPTTTRKRWMYAEIRLARGQ